MAPTNIPHLPPGNGAPDVEGEDANGPAQPEGDEDAEDADEIEIDFGGADPSAVEIWNISKEEEDEEVAAKLRDEAILRFTTSQEKGELQDDREHVYAHASTLFATAKAASVPSLFNEALLVIQTGLALNDDKDPFDLEENGVTEGTKIDFLILTIQVLLVFAEVVHASEADDDDDNNAAGEDSEPKLSALVTDVERNLYNKAKGAITSGLEYIESRRATYPKAARQHEFWLHLKSIEHFAQYLRVQGDTTYAEEIYGDITNARNKCEPLANIDNDKALLYTEVSSALLKAHDAAVATPAMLVEALAVGEKALEILKAQGKELEASGPSTGGAIKRKAEADEAPGSRKRAKTTEASAEGLPEDEGNEENSEDDDEDDEQDVLIGRTYILYCHLADICLVKVGRAKGTKEFTEEESKLIAKAVAYFKAAWEISTQDEWIAALIEDLTGEDITSGGGECIIAN